MNDRLIEFKDVVLCYGKKIVVSELNFSIYKNDFIGIVGPNGVGKTTILRGILGLLKPGKGKILYYPDSKKLKFGYVPQFHKINEIFPLTVYEIVLMNRYPGIRLMSSPTSEDKKKVNLALKQVGMEKYAHNIYRELSGGLRQKVLIARALACEPEMLILDEPTNDLDLASEKSIMDLVKKLRNQTGITVIIVSHLLNIVINYVEKIVFMNKTKCEIQRIEDALTEEKLSHLYNIKVKIGNIENKNIAIAGD